MNSDNTDNEFSPAFERLLAECHPVRLARVALADDGQLSAAARQAWTQLAQGGWLDLGREEMAEAMGGELLQLGEIAGRYLLCLPFAFGAFVVKPLQDADPDAMSRVLGGSWDERLPVAGRVDIGELEACAPMDYFGDGIGYLRFRVLDGAVLARRLASRQSCVQGLDAGVPVAMPVNDSASGHAEYRLTLATEQVKGILRAYLVFSYGQMIGAAAASLDLAIAYAKERVQFRKRIGEFQAVKHSLANAWVGIDNARYAARDLARSQDASAFVAKAQRLDRLAASAAKLATRVSLQVHGAIGFAWEHDAHLYLKRVYRDAAYLSRLVNRMH